MRKSTKRYWILSLIALIGIVGVGRGLFGWQQKRELSVMCETYTKKFEAGEGLSPEEAVAMAERLERMVWTPGLRRANEALAQTDPSQRITLLESAAMELGFANWACRPTSN